MYRTCAFCNGKLDGDGGPSGLGVGRRLAFDEWKGRLWVICPKCSRWNLAPLDDRLERIEALARAAGEGRVAAATEQVALIRWQTYDLVRVGKPRRLEFATWRYGERLRARRREQLKFVLPVTVAAVGLAVAVNVAAGGSVGVFVWNMPNIARMLYTGMVGRRRVTLVEPPICERRSEEHTSELQSQSNLVCRLLLEKKKKTSICKAIFGETRYNECDPVNS